KPVMVLELQSGWFDMFGHPSFVPDRLLTEAVTQSTLALGASYLNLYMFCGGTTFPFWGCRGDIIDVLPKGTGVTTSFDFGGSPVHEWGELNPERYPWMRIFNLFCQDFKSLLLNSDPASDLEVLGGGEEVTVLHDGQAKPDTMVASTSERFKILSRQLGDSRLVMLRNMGDRTKTVDVGRASTSEKIFKRFEVRAHESFMLPVNVPFPGTEVSILHSTSSLLFHQQWGGQVTLGLFGKKDRPGETVLNVPAEEVTVLSGAVTVRGDRSAVLAYRHQGLLLVRVRQHLLMIMDQHLAGKVEKLPDGILIADTYFVRELAQTEEAISLTADMSNGSSNKFYFLGRKAVEDVWADGQSLPVTRDNVSGLASFEFRNPHERPLELTWKGDWKMREDAAEAAPDYRDAAWKYLESPNSLEDGGFLQHGHVWYRMNMQLPKGAKDVKLQIPGNGIDLFYVYVNGQAAWSGISEKVSLEISKQARSGRNTIAILYENFYHTKSHPHEGAIQKYSGIMGPVRITGTCEGKPFRRRIARFRVREGLGGWLKGYANSDYNDHLWMNIPANRKYVMSPASSSVIWMRRKFTCRCRKGWKVAVKLRIPAAKNRLIMYLNGRPLGQFEQSGPQHDFYIPEPYLQDENILALVWEGHSTFGDFAQGILMEPELDTFFETCQVPIEIRLKPCALEKQDDRQLEGQLCL
ncbi:MAG: beta-galactosidase, partial [Lentisphaerota bacterium]